MAKEDILIRKFQSKDISFLTELTNELGYPTSVEQMTLRMNTIVELKNYWTFVAVIQNVVVGYIGLNKNYLWEQDGYYIRIQALVVGSKFRKLGVGKELINSAEELAKQIGTNLLLLNCGNREERKVAHKFYQQVGFEQKSIGYIKRLKND